LNILATGLHIPTRFIDIHATGHDIPAPVIDIHGPRLDIQKNLKVFLPDP
jgi:hypothetical protein